METKDLQKSLFPSLKEEDIEVRVDKFTSDGKELSLLLYKNGVIDAIMLDTIVGKYNWQKKNVRYFTADGTPYLDCVISIRTENGEWIERDGTGEETNFEAKKGQETDAMKRAGFAWGIGRELKNHPPVIRIKADALSTAPSEITLNGNDGNPKTFYKTYDTFSVAQIVYADELYETRRIVKLAIKNETTDQIVFVYDEETKFNTKREKLEASREKRRTGAVMQIPKAPAKVDDSEKTDEKKAVSEKKKPDAEVTQTVTTTATPEPEATDEEPKENTTSCDVTTTQTTDNAVENADYLNVLVNHGKYINQPLSAVPINLIYTLYRQMKSSEEVRDACVLYSLNNEEVAKLFKSQGANPKSEAKARGLAA